MARSTITMMQADLGGLLGRACESAKFEVFHTWTDVSCQRAPLIRSFLMIPLDIYYSFCQIQSTTLPQPCVSRSRDLLICSPNGRPFGVSRVRVLGQDTDMQPPVVFAIVRPADGSYVWGHHANVRVVSGRILALSLESKIDCLSKSRYLL